MIPVYINCFNRLTTTRALVAQVRCFPGAEPIVIDNNSDYEPLLEWFAQAPCEVVRLTQNLGHHAPWLSGVIAGDSAPLYVVTDCDLDLTGVPADVLEVLQGPLMWTRSQPIKSGLALRIDDLPAWQMSVKQWESRWWRSPNKIDPRFFDAAIDTTFALYRGSTPHDQCMRVMGISSVRLAGPYQARHVPWYMDGENLDDENKNYFETANSSNSWRPAGKSLIATYARGKRYALRRL